MGYAQHMVGLCKRWSGELPLYAHACCIVYVDYCHGFLFWNFWNMLVCLCWLRSVMLQAEAIEREVLSLRGEIVGAEEREATMLAQYVNVSFTLWVWSSSVVSHSCVIRLGLHEVHPCLFVYLEESHRRIAVLNMPAYCELFLLGGFSTQLSGVLDFCLSQTFSPCFYPNITSQRISWLSFQSGVRWGPDGAYLCNLC